MPDYRAIFEAVESTLIREGSRNLPEALVLAAFVRYWSGDKATKPIYSLPGVRVEYDW